jgi:hypothetical protein
VGFGAENSFCQLLKMTALASKVFQWRAIQIDSNILGTGFHCQERLMYLSMLRLIRLVSGSNLESLS